MRTLTYGAIHGFHPTLIGRSSRVILSNVSYLIDPMSGTWDEELIRNIFNIVDVRRILQIPLNHQAFDDFVAWHPDCKGIFTVRSAYRTGWIHKYRAHANVMEPGGLRSPTVWSTMWELQIPRNVHIFCWCILHGIIPLKVILTNRHIGSNGACPIIYMSSSH